VPGRHGWVGLPLGLCEPGAYLDAVRLLPAGVVRQLEQLRRGPASSRSACSAASSSTFRAQGSGVPPAFPGGHFFLSGQEGPVVELVAERLF
jgi:hypothetical protein